MLLWGKEPTKHHYRTSLDQSVLAALQGCHFMITISGLSVALQLLDQAVLAALQGCHFIITISGLSVALQPLITLSLSHRLAPALVSRSLQLPHVHVRRFSSS